LDRAPPNIRAGPAHGRDPCRPAPSPASACGDAPRPAGGRASWLTWTWYVVGIRLACASLPIA